MIIKLDGYGEKIYSNNRFDELLAGKGIRWCNISCKLQTYSRGVN